VSVALGEVEQALADSGTGPVRLPALVRGRLELAPSPEAGYVVRRPVLDPTRLEPTGDVETLVLPAVDPAALLPARGACAELLALPFVDVLDYVRALRDALADRAEVVDTATRLTGSGLPARPGLGRLSVELVRGLLDADGLREAVDLDLGRPGVPGSRYLDEWAPAAAGARSGVAAEIRRGLFGLEEPPLPAPLLRALPTRQLHISAGNSAAIAVISALRAFATKSPAVVKSSSASFLGSTLLAVAMHAVDPDHPLTRHTSLVAWPGGDRAVEDTLLAPGGFDRLVAWGSASTVASLRARAVGTRTIFLEPRTGASLIGRGALSGDLTSIAARAAADSLAEDQQSCSASLVHYVEAAPDEALDYCEALRAALARWDAAIPHRPARDSVGRMRRLRRGELARARWLVNERGGVAESSVVCVTGPFDLASHPAGRCVVVQPVEDLADAVERLDPGISTVGIAPEERREELRDAVALRGVSSVVPLGEAERAFAGMPHDGMRILSEMVSWATA
jgi:hypothetical protein